MSRATLLMSGAALSLALLATPVLAAQSPVTIGQRSIAGEMTVPMNKSQMLRVNREFSEITVGNKDIADVVPVSKTQAYVMGKKPGSTSIAIMDGKGNAIAVVDIVVSGDMEGLKARLHEIMPEEAVEVRGAPGGIVLSGMISSADKLREVLAMADRYSPGAVTNMMTVGGSQQVLLHVRFAEVQRTAAKTLGVNTFYKAINNRSANSLGSGLNTPNSMIGHDRPGLSFNDNPLIPPSSSPGFVGGPPASREIPSLPLISSAVPQGALGAAAVSFLAGNYRIDAEIDAMENKGLLRTLAEPNIIALSGDTAKFLAGGEFPIPVANNLNNGINTVTVEFKEFGVGLSFTPTVVGSELINLVLKSEVSSIDPSVSVQTNNITIPGLKVRRANTTVELKDGQSFAIAGLLQDDFRDGIDQVPGAGNIPVLGTLFRSSSFKKQQTELVVFITAHLVQPVTREALASPTDTTTGPNTGEFFFLGKPEGRANTSAAGGGIDGPHGYILP